MEGSKTDNRGKAAAQLLQNEIKMLVEIMLKYGTAAEQDGKPVVQMSFKELFELYKVISNKVVGLLIRARKYKLVAFEGEMLYQGRDDAVVITLLDPNIKVEEIAFE